MNETFYRHMDRLKTMTFTQLRESARGHAPGNWGLAVVDTSSGEQIAVYSTGTGKPIALILGAADNNQIADTGAYLTAAVNGEAHIEKQLSAAVHKFSEIRDLVRAHRDHLMSTVIDHCLDDPDNALSHTILGSVAELAERKSTLIAQIEVIATRDLASEGDYDQ